jgi:hypothetical protein
VRTVHPSRRKQQAQRSNHRVRAPRQQAEHLERLAFVGRLAQDAPVDDHQRIGSDNQRVGVMRRDRFCLRTRQPLAQQGRARRPFG